MTGKQSLLHRVVARVGRAAPIVSLTLAGCLLLAACNRSGGLVSTTAEMDEYQYRRGQQALRTGQNADALEAFLTVIEKRAGRAPESHFEAGRLYLTHFKDPYTAIYHFNKYLEQSPNGLNADGVREQIKTAQKAIFQSIVGQTMGDQVDRLDLLKKIDDQRAMIAMLQAEVQRLSQPTQGPPVVLATQPQTNLRTQTPAPIEEIPPVIQPLDVTSVPPNTTRSPPTRAAPTPPQTWTGKTYTVKQGETLSAISRKFYNTPSQWRAIYELNRDRVPDPNVLKPGTELRLPPQ